MEVTIWPDSDSASVFAADIVDKQITKKPDSVLGVPTGGTPLKMYAELVKRHSEGNLDFRRVSTFNLDEYVGLDPTHPSSYAAYMRQNFLQYINIQFSNVHIPNGTATDLISCCNDYEKLIKNAGGIDLLFLGIGTDGHIGFNEPTSSFRSKTRLKMLTDQTRKDNSKYFKSMADVPEYVITMGIATIMEARRIVLLAFGKKKADIVAAMIEGPLASMVPASILQMHEKTMIILDDEAASKLTQRKYYSKLDKVIPD